MTTAANISTEVLRIEQLGDQHRALRGVLESCGTILDAETYEYLADLHDYLVCEKKRLLDATLVKRKWKSMAVVR